jgi:hypothetical protein
MRQYANDADERSGTTPRNRRWGRSLFLELHDSSTESRATPMGLPGFTHRPISLPIRGHQEILTVQSSQCQSACPDSSGEGPKPDQNHIKTISFPIPVGECCQSGRRCGSGQTRRTYRSSARPEGHKTISKPDQIPPGGGGFPLTPTLTLTPALALLLSARGLSLWCHSGRRSHSPQAHLTLLPDGQTSVDTSENQSGGQMLFLLPGGEGQDEGEPSAHEVA